MKKTLLSAAVATLFVSGCSSHVAEKPVQQVKQVAPVVKTVAPVVIKQAAAPAPKPAPVSDTTGLYPPNAKKGECYARVVIPAQYKTIKQQVLAKAESNKVVVTPAKYKTVVGKVLSKEESTKLEVVPATYKYVTEKVQVAPAKETLIKVPAKYKTVTEKVLVKAAYTTWKKGVNPITGKGTPYGLVKQNGKVISKRDDTTGGILCLVEVPAEYKTITKQVLVAPATVQKKVTPAKFELIKKRVVATPATVKNVKVPAVYKNVKVNKLVSAASAKSVKIPATYNTVTKKVLVAKPKLQWAQVLCETNTNPALIRRLQATLNAKGFKAGKVDGILGKDTYAAISRFQKAANLPVGKLTISTLNKLGVR